MIVKKDLPACPVATTVGLIGNKWKLLIMRDMLTRPKRFGQLQKSLSEIRPKVLTQNLRSMEEDGIVCHEVFAEVSPRVEYSLSDLGNSLRPIITVVEKWRSEYNQIAEIGSDDVPSIEITG